MSIWLENSAKNLLPLSVEKENFSIAIKEWFYTDELIEYEEAEEICELCEKDGLRYHFQIKNEIGNILWVGSKCIEKFGITIYDENGVEITENKEAYLINQAKKKHVKDIVLKFSNCTKAGRIKGHSLKELDEYCIRNYNSEGKFDAKMINYLFQRLENEKIRFRANCFKIDLRAEESKRMLLNLKMVQYQRIKGALSASQRKYYKENSKYFKAAEDN
ncbi:MAG: hypothetical protein JSR71_06630 [Proteobacteria bacterium]|nr:hypothetical protein [Pseudomonadota bacterium]